MGVSEQLADGVKQKETDGEDGDWDGDPPGQAGHVVNTNQQFLDVADKPGLTLSEVCEEMLSSF